jgi:hypothetical protein
VKLWHLQCQDIVIINQTAATATQQLCGWHCLGCQCTSATQCRSLLFAPVWLHTHLAAPAVYYKHVQRKAICGVEDMRLANVEAQVTLAAKAAVTST